MVKTESPCRVFFGVVREAQIAGNVKSKVSWGKNGTKCSNSHHKLSQTPSLEKAKRRMRFGQNTRGIKMTPLNNSALLLCKLHEEGIIAKPLKKQRDKHVFLTMQIVTQDVRGP